MNIRVVKPYVNPDTGEVSKIKIHKHKEAVNASMVVGSRYSGGLNQKDKFKATTTVTGIDPSDYEDNEIRGLKDIREPEQDKDLAKYEILKSRVDMPDAYNEDGTTTPEMQHKAMMKKEMEWTDPEEKLRGPLQKLSEIVGADSAKNVFDYYMKGFLDGKLTGTQDLTNMFNSKDIKYMSDYLTSPEIIKLFKRNGKIKQGVMLSVKEMEDFVLNNRKFQAGLGIKNSIGNLDATGNLDGDSVRIDGNDIVISKAYDFNGLDESFFETTETELETA